MSCNIITSAAHSNALQNILTKEANDMNPHQTTPIASVMNIKYKYQENSILFFCKYINYFVSLSAGEGAFNKLNDFFLYSHQTQ